MGSFPVSRAFPAWLKGTKTTATLAKSGMPRDKFRNWSGEDSNAPLGHGASLV